MSSVSLSVVFIYLEKLSSTHLIKITLGGCFHGTHIGWNSLILIGRILIFPLETQSRNYSTAGREQMDLNSNQDRCLFLPISDSCFPELITQLTRTSYFYKMHILKRLLEKVEDFEGSSKKNELQTKGLLIMRCSQQAWLRFGSCVPLWHFWT